MKKLIITISLSLTFILLIAGCGQNNSNQQLSDASSTKTATIVLETNNAPYTYQDESGDPAGYDYEVLKLVDEYLDDWDFDFTIVDYETALAGLQSNKYDLLTGCKFRTPAREEAYLVSKPYNFFFLNLIVKNDSDIKSLEDVNGKSIASIVSTDGRAVALNDWIAANPETAIDFTPLAASGTMADEIAQVEDGVFDAAYMSAEQAQAILDETGYTDLRITDVVGGRDTVFLYNKKNAELRDAVDAALDALTENGTLGSLTEQWFGQDNFKKAAELSLR